MESAHRSQSSRHARAVQAAVLAAVAIAAAPARAAVYPIDYELPRPGKVSLAVVSASGTTVREILRAAPQAAGRHRVVWDGLDRTGRGVPPGEYHWKLLETPGLAVRYELSVGSNYPIGTDLSSSGGPGTHLAPFAVAADASGIYVAAFQTENIESGIIKLDPNGTRRLWSEQVPRDAKGLQIAWEGARSLAVDKGELFLLGHLAPQRVHVSDAKTGHALRTIDVSWDDPAWDSAPQATHGATDLAVFAGVVAVAYRGQNTIRWYDAASGALLGSAHVAAPAGIALGPGGATYVTSGDRLVELTSKLPTPRVVRAGLVSPGRLDLDHGTGELLVFQEGPSQQVVRLSLAGAVLATYGARGGRQDGLYVDRDFSGVTDLAADGRGGFFVAEAFAAPRRVAPHARDGKVLAEWYGGQPWDGNGAFEPGRPDVMWVASAATWPHLEHTVMRVLVDYAHKTWRVHSTYRYTTASNPLMHMSANEGSLFHIYEHEGTKYLAVEGPPSISRIDEKNWRLIPSTAIGSGFQWNDADGDGRVEENEKAPVGTLQSSFYVSHVDAAFDHYFIHRSPTACEVRRLPVTGWNARGAPVYAAESEVYAQCPDRFRQGVTDPRWGAFLFHDAASGALFAALNPGTADWCLSGDSFVQQWTPSAAVGWSAGELGPSPMVHERYTPTRPGLVYWNLRGLAGVAHDCLVATDVDGGWSSERAQTYVWDRDGLFVGGVMDAPDLTVAPEFMYHLGGELAHSTVLTLPDGDVLFAANWENEVRIYRVRGWDGPDSPWVRATGTVRVRVASRDEVGQGLTTEALGAASPDAPDLARVESPNRPRAAPRPASAGTITGWRWRGSLRPEQGPSYQGYWHPAKRAEAFDGRVHESHNAGARARCRFKGRSIAVVSLTGPSCGHAKVFIDGALAPGLIDCAAPGAAHDAVVFERKGLADAVHTIAIEVVNVNAPAAFNVDKFVVDGRPIDDDGLPYVFYVGGREPAELWLDGAKLVERKPSAKASDDTASAPIKLLVVDHALRLDVPARAARGLSLSWSSPLSTKQKVPVTALFPGY
jgi:hypothetical protein